MRAAVLILVSATGLLAQCPSNDAGYPSLMNAGAAAYKAARYEEAAACFAGAAKADPNSVQARLFLGFSYQSQYKPGDRSPQNIDVGLAARQRFVDVLDIDPRNEEAMASIALLAFQQHNFDESRLWYGKLAEGNPKNKEAPYMLGVLAWTESNILISQAREDLGMKPEDPGPLKDPLKRNEIREQDWSRVEQGIAWLNKALALDSDYDDAMAYMNLLYRQRADLQGDVAYKTDIATAEQWTQKAVAAKKRKAARIIAR